MDNHLTPVNSPGNKVSVGLLIVLLLGFPWRLVYSNEIQPFASDGCSQFPDGTLAQQTLWLSCCTEHDKAYWLGGTWEERDAADKALQVCVEQVGEAEIAMIMLAGVRVGGSPYWFTSYRWGYGWPYWNGWRPRGYRALTEEEKVAALKLLNAEIAVENEDQAKD